MTLGLFVINVAECQIDLFRDALVAYHLKSLTTMGANSIFPHLRTSTGLIHTLTIGESEPVLALSARVFADGAVYCPLALSIVQDCPKSALAAPGVICRLI